jgi:hypothetical protein
MSKEISKQIAKHLRDVHFGGNWTTANLRETLSELSWREATQRINGFNSIAMLVFHVNYFVTALIGFLENGKLEAHDKFSFDLPPINSEADWTGLLERCLAEGEKAAALVSDLDDSLLASDFADKKYGTYYRNLSGTIEHMHYHLGQIALLKKLIRSNEK